MRKIKNLLIIILLLTALVSFFKITSARDARILDGLKKENDKKEYCLKHQMEKNLNDDCRIIIRDASNDEEVDQYVK